jgi:hypothetical protein
MEDFELIFKKFWINFYTVGQIIGYNFCQFNF